MPPNLKTFPAESLRTWAAAALVAAGLKPEDAATCAQFMVQTSLWGIDSHGIARLPHYLERLSRGSIVAQPVMQFEQTAAATGSVDGGHGLGYLVCSFAMKHAISLARDAGVGIVGVRNSSHCGAIGLYTRQAAESGMIGIAFTHSDSFVAPYGGTRAFFGTNPISVAIPSADERRPLCLDMATSVVPFNKIANARQENQPVDPGYGIDQNGRPTTNPHEIAALNPMAQHKGYAMAFIIDMLCGPLNGMPFGPHIAPMYDQLDQTRELGSLMIAFDPARFGGGATLRDSVGTAITEVKRQGDHVLFPGEPEYLSEIARTRDGIPVEPGLRAEISRWAQRLGLSSP